MPSSDDPFCTLDCAASHYRAAGLPATANQFHLQKMRLGQPHMVARRGQNATALAGPAVPTDSFGLIISAGRAVGAGAALASSAVSTWAICCPRQTSAAILIEISAPAPKEKHGSVAKDGHQSRIEFPGRCEFTTIANSGHAQMSRNRGNCPAREQGLYRLSNSNCSTLSHASRHAPVDPGIQNTKLSPAWPAKARDCSVETPIVSLLT